MLDDDGICVEFVDIVGGNENGNYYSQLNDGTDVKVVYLLYRGQVEAAEKLLSAMQSHAEREAKEQWKDGVPDIKEQLNGLVKQWDSESDPPPSEASKLLAHMIEEGNLPTLEGAAAKGAIHPLARPGNKSGAFQLNSGDRFVYDIDGRRGVADEFLQDGEAFVRFDDGTIDTIKWNHMSPEPKADQP
jgi:hypothetical protein